VVGGKPQAVETTVNDNSVRVNAGQVTMSMTAKTSDGTIITPSADGRFTLSNGSDLSLSVAGFEAGAEVEIWLYSDPTFIGVGVADENGAVPVTVEITEAMESGDHHLVVSGRSYTGDEITVATPVTITGNSEDSVITRVGNTVVWVLLGSALVVGLVVPTTLRRRKLTSRK
jgi:hypothetical protein